MKQQDRVSVNPALDARVSGESQAQANEIIALYALRHNIDTSDPVLNLARQISEESFLRGIVYAMSILKQ